MNINTIRTIAAKRNYASLTALQQAAFEHPDTYNFERDMLIVGETSTGKTLIPLLLYAAAVDEAMANGDPIPKMLFIVPYRALAAQKAKELQDFFDGYGLRIVQSTGEFRDYDEDVQAGRVDVAVIINEKAYKYESRDSSFLSKYQYIVADEIGLIDNPERGVRLDFLIAWAKSQNQAKKTSRIILLATPFYDWQLYVKQYDFHVVTAHSRPVDLKEIQVFYADNGIARVEGEGAAVSRKYFTTQRKYNQKLERNPDFGQRCGYIEGYCPLGEPCRHDRSAVCPHAGGVCINPVEVLPDGAPLGQRRVLIDICREHLKKGHQILLFSNNRQTVRNHCKMLYENLKDLLPEVDEIVNCKKAILEECELDEEDVYGLLEIEDPESKQLDKTLYQAFCSGVAFHSRDLPNELRSYVERRLLGDRRLKIVCSTETLAFGVNSTVDVVIVDTLMKQDGGSPRPMTLNEYRNYAGRAGRLLIGRDPKENVGYVYTLIKDGSGDVNANERRWREMEEEKKTPIMMQSQFYDDANSKMAFFLLNLIPTDHSGVTMEDLLRMASILPRDEDACSQYTLRHRVKQAVDYLKNKRLIDESDDGMLGRLERENILFVLTPLGEQLRGYIVSSDDYDIIRQALEDFSATLFDETDGITFLYDLLKTKHAERGLNAVFGKSESRDNDLEIYKWACENIRHLKAGAGRSVTLSGIDVKNNRVYYILAALQAWMNSESVKSVHRRFGVHHSLLRKVAEQIAYLVEISMEILPDYLDTQWRMNRAAFSHKTEEDYLAYREQTLATMRGFFLSLYFGINVQMQQRLDGFLARRLEENPDDSEAFALRQELSLDYLNPQSARKIQRITTRYIFFDTAKMPDRKDKEAYNNYAYQYTEYRNDIGGKDRKFGAAVHDFFRENFPQHF